MSVGDQPSSLLALAGWAVSLNPTTEDLALADRALMDTVAVALSARREPVLAVAAPVRAADITWAAAPDLLRTYLPWPGE